MGINHMIGIKNKIYDLHHTTFTVIGHFQFLRNLQENIENGEISFIITEFYLHV